MKLSKSERAFRIKLVQENHYDKTSQKLLDETVKECNVSYSGLYKDYRCGIAHYYQLRIAMSRSAQGLIRTAQSMMELSDAFAVCATSWQNF